MVSPALLTTLIGLALALPSFQMAARLWRVWRTPMSVDGGAWVRLGVGVMIMEFVLVHAGSFLLILTAVADAGRWFWAVVISLFYGLFAWGISAIFKSRALLHSFLWVLAGRYLALAMGLSSEQRTQLIAVSIVSAVLYLLIAPLSVIVPCPRFGITKSIAEASRQPGVRGEWVDEPHRAIAAGALYFFLLGVAEIVIAIWLSIDGASRT